MAGAQHGGVHAEYDNRSSGNRGSLDKRLDCATPRPARLRWAGDRMEREHPMQVSSFASSPTSHPRAVLAPPGPSSSPLLVILAWAVTVPALRLLQKHLAVRLINTGTTIVTFLMVFLIQNTQNRDAEAIHLKLDELIRAMKGARAARLWTLVRPERRRSRQRAGRSSSTSCISEGARTALPGKALEAVASEVDEREAGVA